MNKLNLKGTFTLEQIRDGKVIHSEVIPNTITDEGKQALLEAFFNGGPTTPDWYVGLIDSTSFASTAATNAYANISVSSATGNGWQEFDQYTDTANAGSTVTRPEWMSDPATTSITNGMTASFDITAAGSVEGLFIADGQTKGDSSAGVLWSAAQFLGGARAVAVNDSLKVTYTVAT